MSRRTNFINGAITLLLTICGLIALVLVSNSNYNASMGVIILYFAAAAIIAGFICTVCHELGHLIFGKANGFAFLSLNVWFFKWVKENGKTVFHFTLMGDEAGYTEMVAKSTENLAVKLKKMTLGGLIATAIPMLIGFIPFFLVKNLPPFTFILWAMFLPIGAYVFFDNALPASSGGAGNDGLLVTKIHFHIVNTV